MTVALADTMRSLTTIPPWSAPIVKGHKPVENRTRNLAGDWRGTIAVLAGSTKWDAYGAKFVQLLTGHLYTRVECHPGHYVGLVDLVDVHRDVGCCRAWGDESGWHMQLANPREFVTPIRARGHLGLRRITDDELAHALATAPTR